MDKLLRKIQLKALSIFSEKAKKFALAGGTALELYYLKHRFSADLDFFSAQYDVKEIDILTGAFKEGLKSKIKFEAEFTTTNHAKVKFYTITAKGQKRPLKIDFVEDVIFDNPEIIRFDRVPVYSAKNIYLQKVFAVTGSQAVPDDTGRNIMEGRKESRDVFDIYMLSKKIQPLHIFLSKISKQLQMSMIHWYRTFSRQDLKLSLLDLDIYDKNFNSRDMIEYIEREIKKFMEAVIDEY